MSRAVSIRKQLERYLERFKVPVVSCEDDSVRLRKCLVSGYFKVGSRVDSADGRTLRVCSLTVHIVLFARTP